VATEQMRTGYLPFGGHPPAVKTSSTSVAAADAIRKQAPSLERQVYEFIRAKGLHGATDEEGAEALSLSGNTYRPRRVTLELKHLVYKANNRRPTHSGRQAFVYYAYAGKEWR
jgi:hypothetical protein